MPKNFIVLVIASFIVRSASAGILSDETALNGMMFHFSNYSRFESDTAIWIHGSLPTPAQLIRKWNLDRLTEFEKGFSGSEFGKKGGGHSKASIIFFENKDRAIKAVFKGFKDLVSIAHPYEVLFDFEGQSVATAVWANENMEDIFRFDCRLSPVSFDTLLCIATYAAAESADKDSARIKYNSLSGCVLTFKAEH